MNQCLDMVEMHVAMLFEFDLIVNVCEVRITVILACYKYQLLSILNNVYCCIDAVRHSLLKRCMFLYQRRQSYYRGKWIKVLLFHNW